MFGEILSNPYIVSAIAGTAITMLVDGADFYQGFQNGAIISASDFVASSFVYGVLDQYIPSGILGMEILGLNIAHVAILVVVMMILQRIIFGVSLDMGAFVQKFLFVAGTKLVAGYLSTALG